MRWTPTEAEAALLKEVLADPADHTRRLAYADCLDENAGTSPCPACGGRGRLPPVLKGGPHPGPARKPMPPWVVSTMPGSLPA